MVHHDNVPAPISLYVQQFMAKQSPIPLLSGPCSDFFLFPKMKLKGKRFNDVLETQQNFQQVYNSRINGISILAPKGYSEADIQKFATHMMVTKYSFYKRKLLGPWKVLRKDRAENDVRSSTYSLSSKY
jgi:hypothetical protein